MTIRVAIRHNTYYDFDRPVALSPHTVRLRPAPHSRTPIHAYSLKVQPAEHFINWQQDAFGNYLARLVFPEKTTRLAVEVEVIADMTVINPFDFFLEEYAEHYPFNYDKQTLKELAPYLEKLEGGPLFTRWLASVELKKMRTIDFLVSFNSRLQEEIEYAIRMEPGVQSPEETLQLAKGSCRDSAWLLVQILRHFGLAARFASGYLVQLKPDMKSLDGPSGTAEDFTDLHAWCEVYLPGAGWVGLDPTSGLFASEGHIPLACTPDPVSAAPINGFTDKCEVTFAYSNSVERVHEDPRVTKPYTEDQWDDVLALGDKVDRLLLKHDTRLTMGGEPTFVSIDDMESPQWNTEALGADKLRLAKNLLLRLRDRFAPNGLLHYGQGKWYPGEEIPRWALGLFWRKDGEPMWFNPKYLARVDRNYHHTISDAENFTKQLCGRLGLRDSFSHPAYEDGLHYLLQEQRLPLNLDAQIAEAKDSLARRRLAKVLDQGLDTPTGYVLPLAWNFTTSHWCSSHWQMRRGRVVLIPGDSPMGLRLPLNDLPYVEETLREIDVERDPLEPLGPLPKRNELVTQYDLSAPQTMTPPAYLLQKAGDGSERLRQPPPLDADGKPKTKTRVKETLREYWEVLRTCLCVEPRDGRLHIFMPPLTYLEHYVNLVACIEAVASDLNLPVVLEGYEPPRDPRLLKLLVTPDPGVIEVNIHPANNWRDLVETTTALYDEARQSRLGTEKFMLDGRHTGTGGGNHVTMGGATPADSPFLRRPDVLRSFITFWQHHPSLSYLFSGMFIGPTSQAPRVDEGRDEMLYELEVAFQQMPNGMVDKPWLVDRLLRNLLIDVTGNTHRAEFCIDKLYAPGSSTGRLGILEFRGFEMPPHERMALVQTLLLRSLLARFWQTPYHKPLVRWGTLLHDRFMLPHYIWSDVKEVVKDLNEHGIEFDLDWLLPFEEFRFPHYGRVQLDDITLEVRWAIEPWHVLGEEVGSFGTARYVDSSVERVQIKAYGLTDSRYMVVCNGRRVPLSATGRHGEYVAGVRYRAWQPPSALHPTIGIHAPLVFDLVDTWNGRSIGGCTYYVSHPGGRSYDTFPVNAFEAESRRVNRFTEIGHTQGPYTPRPWVDAKRVFEPHHGARPMTPPPAEASAEFPHTLDLRRLFE
ncbi:MAG: transglutaminase family protein [Cellvibrionaceae bacterium]|nr:transglutaminase family protein [Cellvibrionaceae bacterium]